jgi:hypothetical protein
MSNMDIPEDKAAKAKLEAERGKYKYRKPQERFQHRTQC